jgi:hypothetical protein
MRSTSYIRGMEFLSSKFEFILQRIFLGIRRKKIIWNFEILDGGG